jgi:type I restriction enzyme, S subunit
MSAIQQLITEHIDIWTAADKAKRSGRGRASGNVGSVYGVKKLRELILELAVRGKLVPQDVTDEPASELLKRIQVEKAKLVAEGKVKKDKPLAAIADDEKTFELPQGWAWSRLGNTGKIFNGNSINEDEKEKKYTHLKEGFPFIATKDVGYGRDDIDYANGVLIPFDNESFKIAHKGAVLICSEGGSAGKKIGMSDVDICFGNKLYANETWAGIAPRFIFYVYQSPSFFQSFSDRMTGIIGGISINEFLNILIPIPPKFEQARIVQKVDELMALCDQLEAQHSNAAEAHEKLANHLLGTLTLSQSDDDFSANWQRIAEHFDTLFTTEASIDALKQTLLQLSVMGKLVPQDANDEPASELLKRIQAEKDKLVAEGKIKKENLLTSIGDNEKPFELPKTWEWVRIGAICRPVSSGSTPSAEAFRSDSGIPFLKVYNIRNQQIDFKYKPQFIDESLHQTKSKRSIIYPNDIVMNIVGPPLGKVAIIPDTFPEWNCNQAIVFFGLIKPMSEKYVLNYLKESSYLNYIELIGTAGQDNISVTKSKNILLPIPPLNEQNRIVAKVDELMALCDRLKTRIQQANQQQQTIADVLVAQAVA